MHVMCMLLSLLLAVTKRILSTSLSIHDAGDSSTCDESCDCSDMPMSIFLSHPPIASLIHRVLFALQVASPVQPNLSIHNARIMTLQCLLPFRFMIVKPVVLVAYRSAA